MKIPKHVNWWLEYVIREEKNEYCNMKHNFVWGSGENEAVGENAGSRGGQSCSVHAAIDSKENERKSTS